MLRAKRDSLGGAASKAIPSLGEVEGRMMVLELIALTALTRLMRLHDVGARADLMKAMRHTINRKCHDARLCGTDTQSAETYAEELLACAQEQAIDLDETRKHA
ncbi:hypothetical protein ACQZ6C_26665 [Rhizobium rhizogenes]